MSRVKVTRFGLALVLLALGMALGRAVSWPAAPLSAPPDLDLADRSPAATPELTTSTGDGNGTATEPLAASLPDLSFGSPTKGNYLADDNWLTFPQKDIDVVWTLSHKPSSLSASDIYRSIQLNPNDVPIPEPVRRTFEGALAVYQTQLDALYKELISRRHHELRELANSGRLLPVNWDAIDGADRVRIRRTAAVLARQREVDASVFETALIGEQLRKQGLRVVTFEGRALYIPRGLQLESSALVDAYADAVYVFTFGVLSWFDACGALRPADRRALSRRLDECVEDVRERYG